VYPALRSITAGQAVSVAGLLVVPAEVALAAFAAGVTIGLLAGAASAAEYRSGPHWRRHIAIGAGWLTLLAAAVAAFVLGQRQVTSAATLAIVGGSIASGVLVVPPALSRRQRAAVVLALPAAFLLLAGAGRLSAAAGGTGRLVVVVLESVLLVLSASVTLAVPAFVLSRPPPTASREPSIGRFLAGAATGLAVAIVPAVINATAIGGGRDLGYLALGIGSLVTALNGEARLLLHNPRPKLAVSGDRIHLVRDVAVRRFLRGALVGGVLSLVAAVLTVAVALLVPGAGPPSSGTSAPAYVLEAGALAIPPFVIAWGLLVGTLNLLVPLLVARLERHPPERYIVPGLGMIAAGALLVDHDALLRLVGL
jgi:hypothetical protein